MTRVQGDIVVRRQDFVTRRGGGGVRNGEKEGCVDLSDQLPDAPRPERCKC